MDTISQVLARLDEAGWAAQLDVRAGSIRCLSCRESTPAEQVRIDRIDRFEGPSDPGDASVVFALTPPCGHRGTLVAGFGPDTPAGSAEAIRALGTARREGQVEPR